MVTSSNGGGLTGSVTFENLVHHGAEGAEGGRHRRSTSRRLLAEDLETERMRMDQWRMWGPYLSERQWGTVREDYSDGGDAWNSFPFEVSHKRAYRWGEDGLLGITDDKCRLCFALAMWNGKDSVLKERLYGLTGPQGNHGEDVKELYYYLDSTPTHSYMKGLYKYTQKEFPYQYLKDENQRRGKLDPEFEITDSGAFDEGKYWDVYAEYAKESEEDWVVRITIKNVSNDASRIHMLPTLWFRNTWRFGIQGEPEDDIPQIRQVGHGLASVSHYDMGCYTFAAGEAEVAGEKISPDLWFTDNETNAQNLYNSSNASDFVKDGFNRRLVKGEDKRTNPENRGTKCAAYYYLEVPGQGEATILLRLKKNTGDTNHDEGIVDPSSVNQILSTRKEEADHFYQWYTPDGLTRDEQLVQRQAYAGLLWSKQTYIYDVSAWLEGDPRGFPPPQGHKEGRNHEWSHMKCHHVLSMPDKWEYPWFAAWDSAFHMIPFVNIDPVFAKEQLLLFLSAAYMHPNGQIPAYEWNFGDVNPPVHAWACWRVYKQSAPIGKRDIGFLKRCFHKLLLNFSWWINRKDADDNNLFGGGFLGLDNIGVFDRSSKLPTGGFLEQADGTSWMAFFASQMLEMALELALHDDVYEDIAIKFFDHLIAIVEAMNGCCERGLWDEDDGFYYDHLKLDSGEVIPMKIKSLVGLVPLFAVLCLENNIIEALPGVKQKLIDKLKNRPELAALVSTSFCHAFKYSISQTLLGSLCFQMSFMEADGGKSCIKPADQGNSDEDAARHYLISIPSRERLERILARLLDENQFLAPYGIRSLSLEYERHPFVFHEKSGSEHRVGYVPGDSDSFMFGGNSNWRGPVWFPTTFLIMVALERYHYFYRDNLKVECPTGSGNKMNLRQVSHEIGRRLTRLFLKNGEGLRPCHGAAKERYAGGLGPELCLFYEYFHPETGAGVGAAHQTGWTGLIARVLDKIAKFDVEDHHDDPDVCT